MNEQEFSKCCRLLVSDFINWSPVYLETTKTAKRPAMIKPSEVYIVWLSKTLQNSKALLSTDIKDGMYYEVTYNGDKDEFYFDAYKKVDNQAVELGVLMEYHRDEFEGGGQDAE